MKQAVQREFLRGREVDNPFTGKPKCSFPRARSMHSSSDRNLLFGVIALQLDFIEKDQLIDGLTSWASSKMQSLAEILVSRGALDSETMEAIDRLVDKRIAAGSVSREQTVGSFTRLPAGLVSKLRDIDDELKASLAEVADNTDTVAFVALLIRPPRTKG